MLKAKVKLCMHSRTWKAPCEIVRKGRTRGTWSPDPARPSIRRLASASDQSCNRRAKLRSWIPPRQKRPICSRLAWLAPLRLLNLPLNLTSTKAKKHHSSSHFGMSSVASRDLFPGKALSCGARKCRDCFKLLEDPAKEISPETYHIPLKTSSIPTCLPPESSGTIIGPL